MLDVHPAHHAASTWREFFIHIATIVIGLLIAVGLEQTVEYVHHRRQLAETREALRKEIAINRITVAAFTAEFHRFTPILQTDLAVLRYLQAHPGAPAQQWPGPFRTATYGFVFPSSAWQEAERNGTIALMQSGEARRYADIFRRIAILSADETGMELARNNLRNYRLISPDLSRLPPATIERTLDDLTDLYKQIYSMAFDMYLMQSIHPELDLTAPKASEIRNMFPSLQTPFDQQDSQALDKAIANFRAQRSAIDPSSNSPDK